MKQIRFAVSKDFSSWTQGPAVENVTRWLSTTINQHKVAAVLKAYPRVLTGLNHCRAIPTVFGAGPNCIRTLSAVFGSKVFTKCIDALRRANKSQLVKRTEDGYEMRVTGAARYHEYVHLPYLQMFVFD